MHGVVRIAKTFVKVEGLSGEEAEMTQIGIQFLKFLKRRLGIGCVSWLVVAEEPIICVGLCDFTAEGGASEDEEADSTSSLELCSGLVVGPPGVSCGWSTHGAALTVPGEIALDRSEAFLSEIFWEVSVCSNCWKSIC